MSDGRAIWIDGPVGKLQGVVREAETPRAAAVLAHPHPLYGGTLHNPVIFHADRELNRKGWTTLRFNFRGVQESDGFHDDGRGEIGDVAAAAAFVRGLVPDSPLFLVGYSFGARCSVAAAISDRTVAGVVAIGLPVRIYDFQDLPLLGRPLAIIQGTNDEFGAIEDVKAAITGTSPPAKLYRIDGATHLFPGRAPEAGARVAEALEEMLANRRPHPN